MIPDKKIAMRIRTLQLEHIRAEVKEKTRRAPHNCTYNHVHTIPNTDGETIGLCMYGSEDPSLWPGDLCDTDEIAQACPYFSCKHDKKDLMMELAEQFRDPDFVREHHPGMASLLWVLTEDPAWMTNSSEITTLYQMDLTWWQRVRLKLGI